MQDLIPERCRPTRPFTNCGVDYAGPYHVRDSAGRGKTAHKAYIAVFVCYQSSIGLYRDAEFLSAYLATTEQISSERVENWYENSTDAILLRIEMRDRCSELGVIWKFNPSAPHFGGMQEAGVKSVKHHLKRIMGDFTPTGEEMQTLLCKIEATLNSCPISPLSEDADDYAVLTPDHFLVGGPLNVLPKESVEIEKLTRLTRWRAVAGPGA
ncbi:uncharacterized protein LOC108631382 [Ceratina calcarata]|uniref:Uncharacterized protein LOC108631382 n=1 Tax=Ceratina calcarata TaxID=156304 RepID=A0AAJ7NEP2_9HYME|nr:uncharacterized protein LOC108631382 [Ceratina calcarata]